MEPKYVTFGIMRMKLLEEECRRHFPLADQKSVAAYVANSLEMTKSSPEEVDCEIIEPKQLPPSI